MQVTANSLHKVVIDEHLFGWKFLWGNNEDNQVILIIGIQIAGHKVSVNLCKVIKLMFLFAIPTKCA